MKRILLAGAAIAALVSFASAQGMSTDDLKKLPGQGGAAVQGGAGVQGGAVQGGAGAQGGANVNRGQGNTGAQGGAAAQGGATTQGGASAQGSGSASGSATTPNRNSGAAAQGGASGSGAATTQGGSTQGSGAASGSASGSTGTPNQGSAQGSTSGSSNNAASVNITTEQRTTIMSSVKQESRAPARDVTFSISIGVAVPQTVVLYTLPPRVVELVPAYRGYRYFLLADGRIVIVEPSTMRIVLILAA